MIPCPHCRGNNVRGHGTDRAKCYDCNRSFNRHGILKRTTHLEQRPDTRCPSCGTIGRHRIAVNRGKYREMACESCGVRFRDDRAAVQESAGDHPVYVITAAVNDSPVHNAFLRAIRVYCDARKARLIVIPVRYKNPTSDRETDRLYQWAPVLSPWIVDKRLRICDGLQVLADIKIQPTAVDPLSGMDTITGTDCGIFGHTKIALRSIATRGHELPKLLLTTGAVTRPSYSDTKAGKKGEFHHVCGATVVEVDGDTFHLRHVHAAADGSFIDLDRRYSPKGVTAAPPALALVMGDLHAERHDPSVLVATGEILATLKPKRLVLHDVLDFGSASHHNSWWERFSRRITGRDKVIDELRETCELIDALHRKGQETVIVSSNHNDHLARWLADHRNGDDVQNAAIYHAAKSAVIQAIERGKGLLPNIFEVVARPMLKRPATFLGDRDSMTVAGIELAYHGDKGPNGARGSAKSFDRIGAKSIIGHSHSPAIVGGCFQTGTSSLLDMGYNVGPSSWLHSHVVVYASGKRSHIHIIGGSWRAGSKRNGQGTHPKAASNATARKGRRSRAAA